MSQNRTANHRQADHLLLRPLADQRGIALIIAISLLAVLTILGSILMSTSTTEIYISGNYRNTQRSFYVAERALEYAIQNLTLEYNPTDPDDAIDIYNDTDANGNTYRSFVEAGGSGLEDPADSSLDDCNTVRFLRNNPPPVGSGSDASVFVARTYAINTVGVFPVTAENPTHTSLRSQVAKIVPK